jgi:hypothetical protein
MSIVENEAAGVASDVAAASPARKNCANILLVLEAHTGNIKPPVERAAFHRKKGLCIGCGGSIGCGVGIGVTGFFTTLEWGIPELAFQNIMLTKRGRPDTEGGLESATFAGAGRTSPTTRSLLGGIH